RDRWKPENITRQPVSFGHNVHANLMFPTRRNDPDKPLPVVVWLHPFNYSHGSNEGYGVEGTTAYYRLAQAGYAVLAYDQCGFGDRLLEGAEFYKNYPHWSKLGRMVFDARCALDFIGTPGADLPPLDPEKVTLLGYSLGGMVALHTAALDDRVAATASFCGFTPMRTDHSSKPTGGIRRWWDWHALLPKLQHFENDPGTIPYDYGDLLDHIAPRPNLVYSARHDRHVDPNDVAACLAQAASPHLKFVEADDVNRFQAAQQKIFMDWLAAVGLKP
ncbi:MAG: alpha/beta fold hydrolase, partial [Verrucomicrobiales bacterium]|nr:alpha/beta fold hydrolase [Verrucomicrobiales bacterium]